MPKWRVLKIGALTVFVCTWIGGLIGIMALVDLERIGEWPLLVWTIICIFAGWLYEEERFGRW